MTIPKNKPADMSTHTAVVTPEEAAACLKDHTNIRPLDQGRVRAILADMLAGKWVENHPQGLIFNAQGKLVNGQHRLAAQVRAGLTLSWQITVNAPPEVELTTDGGKPRHASIGLAAIHGGGQELWRKKTAAARIIRLVGTGSNLHMSPSEAETLVGSLNEPGLDRVYKHSGRPKINAPTLAAFVYAWPCDAEVATLWDAVVAGYAPADSSVEYQKTFAVLQGCISRRLSTSGGLTPKESLYQVLRCIQAIIAGEGLQLAKCFPVAFNAFTEQRKRLGKLPAYPTVPKVAKP